MQQAQQQPLRPVARGPNLTGLAAGSQQLVHSLQSLSALRSAFQPLPAAQPAPLYPEVALFSQFHQLFPGAAELAQHQQLQRNAAEASASARGRTKSNDSKSSSAYASRHQAAEQRRRTRINERCASS